MEVGERGHGAQRIERRQSGPGPCRDHDGVGENEGRQKAKRGLGKEDKRLAPSLALEASFAAENRRVDEHEKRGIADQQHAEHANTERTTQEEPERNDQMPARARQFAADPHQEINPSHHGGGERDVLGVIEHRAVPRAAQRNRERGQERGARAADSARRGPDRDNAADTGQRREQVADRVGLKRKQILQAKGDEIEQAAIEIKISEMKHRLIDEAAPIIGDDQLGIALLHLFVVGDRVVAKRVGDENDQRAEQNRCHCVVTVGASQAVVELRAASEPPPRNHNRNTIGESQPYLLPVQA